MHTVGHDCLIPPYCAAVTELDMYGRFFMRCRSKKKECSLAVGAGILFSFYGGEVGNQAILEQSPKSCGL